MDFIQNGKFFFCEQHQNLIFSTRFVTLNCFRTDALVCKWSIILSNRFKAKHFKRTKWLAISIELRRKNILNSSLLECIRIFDCVISHTFALSDSNNEKQLPIGMYTTKIKRNRMTIK